MLRYSQTRFTLVPALGLKQNAPFRERRELMAAAEIKISKHAAYLPTYRTDEEAQAAADRVLEDYGIECIVCEECDMLANVGGF